MSQRRIRIGHIGTAHDHSADFFECVRRHPELFEIVGVVEPDEQRRKLAREQGKFQNAPWMTEEELADRRREELEKELAAKSASSRAYPLALEKKAAAYRIMYQDLQML